MKSKLKVYLYLELMLIFAWVASFFTLGHSVLMMAIVAPFMCILLVETFSVYYRQRNALWPIAAMISFFCLPSICVPQIALPFFTKPFLHLWDIIFRFINGKNDIFVEYENLLSVDILSYLMLFVMAFLPGMVYAWICYRNSLLKMPWAWNKVAIITSAYMMILGLVVICRLNIVTDSTTLEFGLWCTLSIILAMFSLLWVGKMPELASTLILSFLAVGFFGVFVGFSGANIVSIFALVLLEWIVFGIFGSLPMKNVSKSGIAIISAEVTAAVALFWFSQMAVSWIKIVMMSMSAVLFGMACWTAFWKRGKRLQGVVAFFFSCFFFPVLTLGYNPYRCIDSRIVSTFSRYAYGERGIYEVKSERGYGLRDRYNYILEPRYRSISLVWADKPYLLVEKREACESKYGIYDIEQHSMVIPAIHEHITHSYSVGDYSLKLERLDSLDNLQYEYFHADPHYSRCDKGYHVTMHKGIQALDEHYPEDWEQPGAKYADYMLAYMLSRYDDNLTYDYLTAKDIVNEANTINQQYGVFSSDTLDVFNEALFQIECLIDRGSAGSQSEMNHWASAMAFLQRMRMGRSECELMQVMDSAMVAKEYIMMTHWWDVKDRFDLYRNENGADQHLYSSYPMDYAAGRETRYLRRRILNEELIDLFANGTPIPVYGDHPFVLNLKRPSLNRDYSEYADPVMAYYPDSIEMAFYNWIIYREKIANRLPADKGRSYRNQTINIVNDEFNPSIESTIYY